MFDRSCFFVDTIIRPRVALIVDPCVANRKNQTRVSRVLQASKRRETESCGAANAAPQHRLQVRKRAPSAVRFIPPPLSCLGIGFWYMFRPTFRWLFCILSISLFAAKTRQKRRRSSHTPPKKILRKKFWKDDNVCHISCAIIEAKENTHARNQSL